jgi:hypothetical protein
MDTEAPKHHKSYSSNPLVAVLTSFSAAVVVAGGFGIVMAAFIIATANLLGFGQMFVIVGCVLTAAATLWLGAWTFARSWHVEQRLKEGLDVDDPKLSILANFRR